MPQPHLARPHATASPDPVALETLKTLATPREVDFLIGRALGDADVDAVPRGRESMAFLAGVAVRARNAGAPFEAAWALIARRKGLDRLADPAARAFWTRVRFAMRALASPDWRPDDHLD